MKADSETSLDTAPKHTDFLNQSTTMSQHNQDSSPPVPTPPSSHLRVSSSFINEMFGRRSSQPDQPPHPILHTPSWSSPVFTSVPAQNPSHHSVYPSILSVHWPPIPTSVPFISHPSSSSVHQSPIMSSVPFPSYQPSCPSISGLR